ncbi:MAG: hypothetical protein P8L47_00585 [Candidatus Marinamargulisbacteria bacterium]|nr:hypothetical protein [Candidatus Marinamargulisbacteria bacterium]
MPHALTTVSRILESPITYIRQYDFQLSWGHAGYVVFLISVASQANRPFSSIGMWGARIGLGCIGWLVGLAIISAMVDFWAQYLGYRSKLKPVYASLGLIVWPLILYLPIHLIHPTAWSWVSPVIHVYIGVQACQVIRHHYQLSTLKAVWLMALPGVSAFIALGLAIVFVIRSFA